MIVLGLEGLPLGLARADGLHERGRRSGACADGFDIPSDLLVELVDARGQLAALDLQRIRLSPSHFQLVPDERAQGQGIEEIDLELSQHLIGQRTSRDAMLVEAGRITARSAGRADVGRLWAAAFARLARDDQVAAAQPTPKEPAQQIVGLDADIGMSGQGAVVTSQVRPARRAQPRMCRLPEGFGNDPKILALDIDRSHADDLDPPTLAVGVLRRAINRVPPIELAMKDGPDSRDRPVSGGLARSIASLARRIGDTFVVQDLRGLHHALAVGTELEDPPDELGLIGVDLPTAILGLADGTIAKDAAISDPALCGLGPFLLAGAVLGCLTLRSGERRPHAQHPAMERTAGLDTLAIRVRPNLDTGITQGVDQPGQLFVVAAQPVEISHDQDLELLAGCGGEHPRSGHELDGSDAADPIIDEDVLVGDGPALLGCERPG